MNELQARTKEKLERNSFMNHNYMELHFLDPDHAVFKLDIREESRNTFGMVHGGALYALADNATGCAAHTDGRHYVTQGSSFNFLRNQPSGTVYADAKVRHRGGTTCLIDVELTGEGGKLLASGTFTYFCVDRSKIEAKAGK